MEALLAGELQREQCHTGCVAFDGVYSERPLYNSRQPLGLTTHKIKLPLPATVYDYRNCSLAFQVDAMTTGVAAVFSDISVFADQCSPPCEYAASSLLVWKTTLLELPEIGTGA